MKGYNSVRASAIKSYKKAAPVVRKNAPIARDAYQTNVSKAQREKNAKNFGQIRSDVRAIDKELHKAPKRSSSKIQPRPMEPPASRSSTSISRGPEPRPMHKPPSSTPRPMQKPPSRSQGIRDPGETAAYGMAGRPSGLKGKIAYGTLGGKRRY